MASRPESDIEIDCLARVLHFTLERLDPNESMDWDELSDRSRDFYRLSIKGVLGSEDFKSIYNKRPATT